MSRVLKAAAATVFGRFRKKLPGVVKVKVGYWNGYCPFCGQHIGVDVYKDLARHVFAVCGYCSRELQPKHLNTT